MSTARSALERIQPRVVSYEEPVTTIREQLAATLEREEDWAKAAQVLAGIDLDSGAPAWLPPSVTPSTGVLCTPIRPGQQGHTSHFLFTHFSSLLLLSLRQSVHWRTKSQSQAPWSQAPTLSHLRGKRRMWGAA